MLQHHDLHSEVFTAVYSGVQVFEMTCRGVSVMRRIPDSALNATQILKVAGIEKGRRTKILEREILTGPHQKIQGGYGKYQGTWISYEIGLALCERHGVRQYLSALLDLDPENVSAMNATPTKEQHQASVRRQLNSGRPSSVSGGSVRSSAPLIDSASLQGRGTSAAILASLQPKRTNLIPMEGPSHQVIEPRFSGPPVNGQATYSNRQSRNGNMQRTNSVLEPLNSKTAKDFDGSRESMTGIFLESDVTRVPDVLLNSATAQEVDIDVPIDELGHTALHWASALARLPLVKALIARGADPCRGNGVGETPLIRAVLVTNTMDQNTFIDLLDLLKDSIALADSSKRSILHHIAITAGIKGRSSASRYYLDSLLEWIVMQTDVDRMSLPEFEQEVVNLQDRNGDTALNIAARIGNRSIVQSLLEINADPYLPNKAGIRPIDSGTVDTRIYQLTDPVGMPPADPVLSPSVVQASGDVIASMTSVIASLQKDFEEEMAAKSLLVENTNLQLREAGRVLADLRNSVQDNKTSAVTLERLRQRIQNTNRAIINETKEFEEAQPKSDPVDQGIIDADALYVVDLSNTANLPSKRQLQARIRAYEKDLTLLDVLAVKLNDKSAAMEARCRKVVSECAGVAVDQVDALLPQLLAAVQSDSTEEGFDYNEASRVAGFLRILTPR